MSATKAAPQINRKQTRVEVDGQIQKSIPTYLQAAPWQRFEKMVGKHTLIDSCALRWGDVSLRDDPVTGNEPLFFKFGSSRAYQDYDQEQGEHLVQPGAVRLNKFFAKYRPSEAKKPRSLRESAFCFFASIVVLMLEKLELCSKYYLFLFIFMVYIVLLIMNIIIIIIIQKNRALKNNRGREAMTRNTPAVHRLPDRQL